VIQNKDLVRENEHLQLRNKSQQEDLCIQADRVKRLEEKLNSLTSQIPPNYKEQAQPGYSLKYANYWSTPIRKFDSYQ
jgi:uncharacterized protein (UPF0335 family)